MESRTIQRRRAIESGYSNEIAYAAVMNFTAIADVLPARRNRQAPRQKSPAPKPPGTDSLRHLKEGLESTAILN